MDLNLLPNDVYFCVFCSDIPPIESKTELEQHLRRHLSDSTAAEETQAIEIWLERHLKYQESLNRSMSQTTKTIPDRSKTIYKGCPVCDRIISVCMTCLSHFDDLTNNVLMSCVHSIITSEVIQTVSARTEPTRRTNC